MKHWAGPQEYTYCYFPHQETPTQPGIFARPTLVFGTFFAIDQERRLALVMGQTANPGYGRDRKACINVNSDAIGLPPLDGGKQRWLSLKHFMVLDADDPRFFPEAGRVIGRLNYTKFQEVAATIVANRLVPRMRAVMDIAPEGIRERCVQRAPFVPAMLSKRAPSAEQHPPRLT